MEYNILYTVSESKIIPNINSFHQYDKSDESAKFQRFLASMLVTWQWLDWYRSYSFTMDYYPTKGKVVIWYPSYVSRRGGVVFGRFKYIFHRQSRYWYVILETLEWLEKFRKYIWVTLSLGCSLKCRPFAVTTKYMYIGWSNIPPPYRRRVNDVIVHSAMVLSEISLNFEDDGLR